MDGKRIRAVSYNRVSTEEEKQLDALSRQVQENKDVIGKMNWEFVREYIDEGKSGTQTRKRSGYNQLYRDLEGKDFDIVVIKDQDRLMRNPKDWYLFVDQLLKHDKKLYIHLDSSFYTPDNALLTGIKAILAEEYSRHLSRKINLAHKNRQEKGESIIITNQTWGYRKMPDGSVSIDETERYVIEMIFTMYAQGMGSRLICRELNNAGIRNRKGNTLAESQIRAIVRNPLYKGMAVMNKTHIHFDTKRRVKLPEAEWIYHENKVPPIVSAGLWAAANQTIDRNSKRSGARKTGVKTGRHMLSGKVICGECGQKYWRNQRNIHKKSGPDTKAVYWYCSEYYRYGKRQRGDRNGQGKTNGYSSGCSSLRLKEEELYDILRQIGGLFIDRKNIDELLEHMVNKMIRILTDQKADHHIERLREEKENLISKKERLLDLLIDGVLHQEDYRKRRDEILSRLEVIEELQRRHMQDDGMQEDISTRISRISQLLPQRALDPFIPIMAFHVEQIKVFATKIDFYFDFLSPLQPLTIVADMKNGIRVFAVC